MAHACTVFANTRAQFCKHECTVLQTRVHGFCKQDCTVLQTRVHGFANTSARFLQTRLHSFCKYEYTVLQTSVHSFCKHGCTVLQTPVHSFCKHGCTVFAKGRACGGGGGDRSLGTRAVAANVLTANCLTATCVPYDGTEVTGMPARRRGPGGCSLLSPRCSCPGRDALTWALPRKELRVRVGSMGHQASPPLWSLSTPLSPGCELRGHGRGSLWLSGPAGSVTGIRRFLDTYCHPVARGERGPGGRTGCDPCPSGRVIVKPQASLTDCRARLVAVKRAGFSPT